MDKEHAFVNCKLCNKSVYIIKSRVPKFRFCSKYCMGIWTGRQPNKGRFKKGERLGKDHWNYKGGTILPNGYKQVYYRGKIILEHRFIMGQHLCRKLLRTECVHHINHNRSDNRIENLMIIGIKEHGKMHSMEGHKKRWGKKV